MAGGKQDSSVISLTLFQKGGGGEWMLWREKSCLFLAECSLRPLLCPTTQVKEMGGNVDQKITSHKELSAQTVMDLPAIRTSSPARPTSGHQAVSNPVLVHWERRLILAPAFEIFRALTSNAVVECIGTEVYFPSTWAHQKIWKNLEPISPFPSGLWLIFPCWDRRSVSRRGAAHLLERQKRWNGSGPLISFTTPPPFCTSWGGENSVFLSKPNEGKKKVKQPKSFSAC